MKIIKTLLILSLIGLIIAFGLSKVKQELKTDNKKDFLAANFPNGYSSNAVKVGEDLIVYTVSSSTNPFIDSPENYDSCNKNPLVYLIKQGQIKSVFEIKIGDFCVSNSKFIVFKDMIISEWIGDAGGSGGLRGLILWKIINGELQAIGGYPNDSGVFGTSLIKAVNINNPEQSFSYPLGDMNAYSAYLLKNPLELRYAEMIWKVSEESHSSPHQWYLASYILSNNGFIRNPNWNNGETFVTKEKIEGWGDEVKDVVNVDFEKLGKN